MSNVTVAPAHSVDQRQALTSRGRTWSGQQPLETARFQTYVWTKKNIRVSWLA